VVDGGHGKWRGGYGLVKDYRITNSSAFVTASFGRNKFPPWGLAGGMHGTPNSVEMRTTDGGIERRGRFSKEELHEGDVARFITGMGGGYGDPMERDPQAVLDDVMDGYITQQTAEKVYGVALTGDPLAIDEVTTKHLRGE